MQNSSRDDKPLPLSLWAAAFAALSIIMIVALTPACGQQGGNIAHVSHDVIYTTPIGTTELGRWEYGPVPAPMPRRAPNTGSSDYQIENIPYKVIQKHP